MLKWIKKKPKKIDYRIVMAIVSALVKHSTLTEDEAKQIRNQMVILPITFYRNSLRKTI